MNQRIITILNFTIGKVFIFDITNCENDDEETLCIFLEETYDYNLNFDEIQYMITKGLSFVMDI